MDQDTLDALEQKLDELTEVKVFNEDVKRGVDSLISSMPNPDEERDSEKRVKLLILRCRALTLLPSFSMEAERDCTAALKLRADRPELWVLLSECLARRKANREACDALDSALRIDSRSVKALCQYSRILRVLAGDSTLTPAERRQHLSESVARGKAAAASCPEDADGWHCYAIALLSESLVEGVKFDGVQKALYAMRQASRICPNDPDVRFNKGTIEGLLGHFGNAACDFLAAYEVDPIRLKGTRQYLEEHLTVLRRLQSRMEGTRQAGKRAFTSILAKLPESQDTETIKAVLDGRAASRCHVTVGVMDILSEPTMEPMVVLAAEKSGECVLLLFYGLLRNAIKVSDTVITLSFPGSTCTRVQHDVPAIPLLDTSPYESTITQVFVGLNTTLVNGAPIPACMRALPKMSSRLFI